MSIHPVSDQTARASEPAAKFEPAHLPAGMPIPGSSPKQDGHDPQKTVAPAEFPQDEVQVQRDQGVDGEIVIRYMDQSGDVILQIPSSQVLGVSRAIEQELALAAKARASQGGTLAGSEGGEVHGH